MGFNLLDIGDTIWHSQTWSRVIQVMPWWLMASGHDLIQCWYIINKVLWLKSESNLLKLHASIIYVFENDSIKIPTTSPKLGAYDLTHWGRVTHMCVGNLTINGSENGLSSGQRQAIIWTNAGILLIGPLGTNFNEISIKIHTFSFKKMHFKMASAKWRPFCLGLNVLTHCGFLTPYDIIYIGQHWFR